MSILKEILFNVPEVQVNNLYEVCGGVVDISDDCITFDNGISWRDARPSELEAVESLIFARDVMVDEPEEDSLPCISDDMPDIRNDSGYVKSYSEDIYLDGLSKGFVL